eukprot:2862313-Heterocapsa_arctica.AAC.1
MLVQAIGKTVLLSLDGMEGALLCGGGDARALARLPGPERGERATLACPGSRVRPLGAVRDEHPGAGEMCPAVEASN